MNKIHFVGNDVHIKWALMLLVEQAKSLRFGVLKYHIWSTEIFYYISYINANEHVACPFTFMTRSLRMSFAFPYRAWIGIFRKVQCRVSNCLGFTWQNIVDWRKKSNIIYQIYEHTCTSQNQPMKTPMSIVWFDYILNINMYTCVSNYTSSIKSTIQLHVCPEVHDNAMVLEYFPHNWSFDNLPVTSTKSQ